MKVILCDESHAERILAIFNDAIANSTALYDYRPRTMGSLADWFEAKRKGNFPVVGALDDNGLLLGFASYGVFRAWAAYKYTVEHSVYVAVEHRGKGVGKQLLRRIIAKAEKQDYHTLVGCIDSQNAASIAMHRTFGFEHVGTIREVGFKFGAWLDLELHQLILKTPENPMDG